MSEEDNDHLDCVHYIYIGGRTLQVEKDVPYDYCTAELTEGL